MSTVRDSRFVGFVCAVVLVNVAALAILGLLVERNTDRIERNTDRIAATTYNLCVSRNINLERLNNLYAGLAKVERDNLPLTRSPETIQRRIDLYTAARQDFFDCGKAP